jgi:threonine/homoserine/homoserine lactone efflux protein
VNAVILAGFVLGFSIAAPVGPIGVLCIRRTLAHGLPWGVMSGLGAATADACFGMLAAFGITALPGVMSGIDVPLKLTGGAFLVFLGVMTLRTRPPLDGAEAADPPRLIGAYGSTYVLTLTNPMTILMFASMLASLGLSSRGPMLAVVFVAGVFSGSAAWWLLLSGTVSLVRSRFDARAMHVVNVVSGGVIAAFGVFAVYSAVMTLLA